MTTIAASGSEPSAAARAQLGLVWAVGQDGCAGGGLEVGPGLGAVVDVVELEAGLVEEPGQVDVGVHLAQGAQLFHLARPARWDGLAQAAQDDLGGLLVELHVAAGGQERELLCHGALELPAGAAEQGPVAAVEAELAAVGAHEVEDRAEPLARRAAQAPAELLKEQRGTLRGAQHEHGVDGGHVDALVEQVDGEHRADLAVGQVTQGGVSRTRTLRFQADAIAHASSEVRLAAPRHRGGRQRFAVVPASYRREMAVLGDPAGYELAYRSGLQAVDEQASTLRETRDRAGSLLSAAAVAGGLAAGL
ncbi:MAG TPA: hypothetical protein VGA36_03760, partial [Nitriliruptorales bacterium]